MARGCIIDERPPAWEEERGGGGIDSHPLMRVQKEKITM
uniref:Uncharacterized protein n=1 Tax=Vibrio splendidus TaxID=29497 RepID=A0A0H3ZJ84_VIBSP|nr:hypothetical protein [Vibrio splendidus]